MNSVTDDAVIKTDFFLKLPSEADMPEVLAAFYEVDTQTVIDEETGEQHTVTVGDPYLVLHTQDYAIDILGIIHKPTGVMLTDSEGNEYPETAPVDGWHINIRLSGDKMREVVEAIDAAYGVEPRQPVRLFL